MNTVKSALLKETIVQCRGICCYWNDINSQSLNKNATGLKFSFTQPLHNKKHEEFKFSVPADSIKNHCISAHFQKGKLHENKIGKKSLQRQWVAIPI